MNTNSAGPQIAVVVAVYNSNWDSLAFTLASITMQEGVDFQVLIADDGSVIDQTVWGGFFLAHNGVRSDRIRLLRSDSNRGTVANIRGAIDYVSAPYVKLISPGDALYDCNTLASILQRFENGDADILFGKAVQYGRDPAFRVYDVANPVFPDEYNTKIGGNDRALRALLVGGDNVLGASMAYKVETLKRSLAFMGGSVKYVEDNTTLAYVLAHGGSVEPMDSYVVWYERGPGISTGADSVWAARLKSDFSNFWKLLFEECPERRELQSRIRHDGFLRGSGKSLFMRKAIWAICHPKSQWQRLRIRRARSRLRCQGYDLAGFECAMELSTDAGALSE